MTALNIAAAYGLPLRQKGARYWARCPLHGEKTPSLCFFPDGRWYCFGCHQHGDAADLYAALYGVPLAEALRVVKGERPTSPRKSTASDLRRKVERWSAERWAEACRQKHEAQAALSLLEAHHTPETLEGTPAFWTAVQQAADAEDMLNLLTCATPAQRLRMIAKEMEA